MGISANVSAFDCRTWEPYADEKLKFNISKWTHMTTRSMANNKNDRERSTKPYYNWKLKLGSEVRKVRVVNCVLCNIIPFIGNYKEDFFLFTWYRFDWPTYWHSCVRNSINFIFLLCSSDGNRQQFWAIQVEHAFRIYFTHIRRQFRRPFKLDIGELNNLRG